MSKVLGVKEKLISAILDLRLAPIDQGEMSETADKMVVEIRINELINASQQEVVDEANAVIDEQNDTIQILAVSQNRLVEQNTKLRLINVDAEAALQRAEDAYDEMTRIAVKAEQDAYRARVDNTLLRERVAELEASPRVRWNSGDSAPDDGSKFYGVWLNGADAPEIATVYYDTDEADFVDDLGNVVNNPDFWAPLTALPVPERG